ncbi:MAG TPA: ATP-binding protein [Anaeromyxobacteraceae bacterium]|nr:ATP-binding protein [Anaeromyxobacteraceae bacterium]
MTQRGAATCLYSSDQHTLRVKSRARENDMQVQQWFFEHSSEGVVLGAASGAIRRANRAACGMLGWSEEDLRGGSRPVVEALEPLVQAIVAAAHHRGTARSEVVIRRPNGSVLTAMLLAAGTLSINGEQLVCMLLRDQGIGVREAKAPMDAEVGVEDEPNSTREWLESVPAIAWRTDEHANIIERNRQWFDFTGRSVESSSGTDWLEVIHPDDRLRLAEAVRVAVSTGGALESEFRVRRADGLYRWFLGRALPVRDRHGRVSGWMGIGTDIEDRRRAEQALRDADTRKNEFLGVLSHELRNPLAPITTAIYILEHSDPAGEQGRRARDIIGRQTTHLARLVDDLLDVTRIIRGKIELRRVRLDLGEIVRRTGEDYRAAMENHGVEFVVQFPSEPLWVNGDQTRIAQIVGNVLHNASKFTPRGGRVELCAARRLDACEICVKDNGAGIAPDLLERLFQPFAQGPQGLARTSGGLGLGLALVKGLAELHGGSVKAFSEGVGQGTTVVVTLPLV